MDISKTEMSHNNSSVLYLPGGYDFGDCVTYYPGGKVEENERSYNEQNKDAVTDSDESVYHHTSDQEADVGFHEVQDVSSQETYYVGCEELYHVRAGSDSIYQTDEERDEDRCQQFSSLSQETDAFFSAEEEWSKSHDDVSRLIAGLDLHVDDSADSQTQKKSEGSIST